MRLACNSACSEWFVKPDMSAFGDRDSECVSFVEELCAYEERSVAGVWAPYKAPFMDAVSRGGQTRPSILHCSSIVSP